MILLKTSSQKNEKEVKISSIMNKKIRKMLIVQLTIIEIILIILLFDTEANSCVVDHENNNLLVYNYSANTLLASKVVKEDVELEIENIDEDEDASETVEELEEVQDEVEQVSEPEPVVETVIATPIAIKDVDYTVAQNLVNYAVQFVGYPYVYGGNSLTNGTDCSGFTKLIYAEYGVDLPRVAYDQSFVGVEVPISEIQIGD